MISCSKKLYFAEGGSVLVELAMSFSLLLIIVLGFAQQYLRSIDKMDHYALGTQVIMGPQEKSMSYDPVTGIFSALSGATTPTYDQFVDTIGNFLLSRAPNQSFAFYIRLAHLVINPSTGEPTNYIHTTTTKAYLGANASGGCEDFASNDSYISGFANDRLTKMKDKMTSLAPTDAENDNGRVGLKLYDFRLGSTRYRQYAEVYPIIFLHTCSTPVNVIFSQRTETYLMIVPRRHIN